MTYHRYPPLEAPDVQVLVDGTWYDGVAEARRQEDDGQWLWFVRWSSGLGETRLGWFGREQLRMAEPPA